MKKFLLLLLLISFQPFSNSQKLLEKQLRGYNAPDELITLSANIPFNDAIELINQMSMKKSGKRVIALIKRDAPIGVEIINVPYDKALLMIVQYAGLVYEETESSTIIKTKIQVNQDLKPETYADIDTREIKISAIFFELDVTNSKDRGVNWQFLLSNKAGSIGTNVKTTGDATTSGTTSSSDFTLSTSNEFGLGGYFGQALSLFRYFETQNLGEIIASPSITVRNKVAGNIQVGSDFSIKQRDFSGNVVDNFFKTGSIVKVTPYIYEQDSLEYTLLDLEVERSSGFPSELSTEIKRTSAKTQVLMLDGEETVIGGLYLNEENKVRNGIPFLKDLPWWVLGIRYLTGSDQVTLLKKELVIVIKIELLPKLKERLAFPSGENPIERELKNKRDKIQYYKFNETPPK
ncbi:MAG: hypothetical protein HYV28_12815 [Ignavibacteriales bacterium]|nr:hypothetical protein [Ignavibacteriales bacterium]